MRISHVSLELSAEDLQDMVSDLAPDTNIRINTISSDGIWGQIKLFLWNIDFIAKPSSTSENEASVDISAHKLVPVPAAVVQWQLREAMRDAPLGVDVVRQSLKVHIPSILAPFGAELQLKRLECGEGVLRIEIANARVSAIQRWLNQSRKGTSRVTPSLPPSR